MILDTMPEAVAKIIDALEWTDNAGRAIDRFLPDGRILYKDGAIRTYNEAFGRTGR